MQEVFCAGTLLNFLFHFLSQAKKRQEDRPSIYIKHQTNNKANPFSCVKQDDLSCLAVLICAQGQISFSYGSKNVCRQSINLCRQDQQTTSKFYPGYIEGLKIGLEESNENIIDLSNEELRFFIEPVPSIMNSKRFQRIY